MKELTLDDIKVGSIWEEQRFKGKVRYRIDKVDKRYGLIFFSIIEKSEDICECGCSDIGTKTYVDFGYFIDNYHPAYTVEGFEV